MPLITWTDDMRLGLDEVDYEHQDLIDVINALGDQLEKGGTPEDIQALLGEIHAQIEGHFALEERIMRDRGFSGFDAHKEDHDRLLEQIRDIMTDAHTVDGQDLRAHLAKRLKRWFTEHFRTLDRSFHNLD